MLRSFALLLVLSTSPGFLAHAQDARVVTRIVTDTMPAWNTWKADAGSMNYPGTWTVDTMANGDTTVVFRKRANAPSTGSPMVALIIIDNTLHNARSQKGIGDISAKDVQIIASSAPDASGASSMEYTGNFNGVLQHGLRKVQVHGDRSYILSYTSTAEGYDEHLFLAEAMMNSFSPSGKR